MRSGISARRRRAVSPQSQETEFKKKKWTLVGLRVAGALEETHELCELEAFRIAGGEIAVTFLEDGDSFFQ